MKYKQIFNSGVTFQQFYDTAQDRYKNYANNAIRNYLNLKNFQTQQIPVIKKCNFLLKNVKKYLKNCESMDILTYTYFYNIFEKVNDNI